MYFHGVEEVVVVEGAVVVTVMPVALARRRSQRGRAFENENLIPTSITFPILLVQL